MRYETFVCDFCGKEETAPNEGWIETKIPKGSADNRPLVATHPEPDSGIGKTYVALFCSAPCLSSYFADPLTLYIAKQIRDGADALDRLCDQAVCSVHRNTPWPHPECDAPAMPCDGETCPHIKAREEEESDGS